MNVFSILFRQNPIKTSGCLKLVHNNANASNLRIVPLRMMSEQRSMHITPTRFQYNKFKDLVHFYVMLGAIPMAALITYVNMFVGPAELQPIPDGYEPKNWEYYEHPISRWMAKHMFPTHQEEYEKFLHYAFEVHEKIEMQRIETKVYAKMKENKDSQVYYHKPVITEFHKEVRSAFENYRGLGGD